MPTHTLKVSSEEACQRLDVFLTQHLSDVPSRNFVKKLIDDGFVKINDKSVKAHHKLCEGEKVFVDFPDQLLNPPTIEPEDTRLDIIFEDDYLLIINKPCGMLVHPASGINKGTLVNALLHHCEHLSDFNGRDRQGIVHRLDRETSGLMVVAKDNVTHTKLAKQFKKHTVHKQYAALVKGHVEFDEGVIDAPIAQDPRKRDKKSVQFMDEARDSLTHYKVLKRYDKITLIELYPKTGRTHQLRVHMAYLGHPILGDPKYGPKSNFPRLALHAQSLGFIHPQSKKFIEFTIDLPPEFNITL